MSKSSTLSDQTKHLKDAVMHHAADISALLSAKFTQVSGVKAMVDNQIAQWMYTLRISDDLLTVPTSLGDVHIHVKGLYEAIQNFDTSDVYSHVEILHEVLSIIKEILPKLATMSEGERGDIFRTLDGLDDLVYDLADLLDYGIGDDVHSLAEWATSINKTAKDLTDQMQDLGMPEEIADTIRRAISPLLNIIIMVIDDKNQGEKEDDPYWDDENLEVIKDSKANRRSNDAYERHFDPYTENIIHNVSTEFAKINEKVKEIPFVDELEYEEDDFKDIWYFSIKRLRSLDWENFDDIHFALENIKENINKTLDFVIKKYLSSRPEVINIVNDTVRDNIDNWLTLDPDFRTNNWVEVIHHIVKNIHKSLEDSMGGSVPDIVLQFIKKLDGILDLVDNENFKLLITPKEDIEMHKINLPDILSNEPVEKPKELPKEEEEKTAKKNQDKPLNDSTTKHILADSSKKIDGKTEASDTSEDKKLTIGKIIDFLCFDKTHGATAKMDPILADVIHDLYYRDWLSYRLEHLEDEVMSIFTIEKYKPIWEDIKAKLLDEKGVNLGDFITYLIEKVVSVVNELITFVKDTIQYIIDEIFNLVKAIIQFFEKVDLPADARNFLKTIPLFKDMPDDVTILHIIAAIPYTLYQEFISFEVPKSDAA